MQHFTHRFWRKWRRFRGCRALIGCDDHVGHLLRMRRRWYYIVCSTGGVLVQPLSVSSTYRHVCPQTIGHCGPFFPTHPERLRMSFSTVLMNIHCGLRPTMKEKAHNVNLGWQTVPLCTSSKHRRTDGRTDRRTDAIWMTIPFGPIGAEGKNCIRVHMIV